MRRALYLSLGLALALGLVSGEALAKARKQAPAAQGAVAQDPNAVPLPSNLKTNKDWLDDGAGNPATGNLQPDAQNNDNYFIQQRGGYDPTWYTEAGSIFDGR
ncbi:MAG: cellulose-binding protein [Methylocystis sp.]|uniref:cellulose-binding protein n=1 Tax=Methylocystis sp. TaxID=1911079 RepID=UPI003DA4ED26